MRAAGLIAFLASVSAPAVVTAQALPPAPYQAADQSAAVAAAPPSVDRYGGFQHPTLSAQQPAASSAPRSAPSGPYLAWAGKTEAGPQTQALATDGGWTTMSRQWDAAPTAVRQAYVSPAVQDRGQFQAEAIAPSQSPSQGEWRPLYPQGAPTTRAAPTSIYDAPTPAASVSSPAPVQPPAQPYRQAQAATGGGPRFYSLHREYGLSPDAIPLPPQFFGPTADLSAPATDPLARRTTTVNGQTRTVVVPDTDPAQ